ncbi:ATP-binding protein [Myxococcota bacterium]|nr:ATP-binding protein [Myxococcota bacterium]
MEKEYEDISGVTEINDEGIKKHFKNIEPWQPLFELVWNGFDANANRVDVEIVENQLQGVENVFIFDDGRGINPILLKETFGRFNESEKHEDAAQHGAHGKGRLAFHCICNLATWYTKNSSGCAEISINSNNLKNYSGKLLPIDAQHPKLKTVTQGTYISLSRFTSNLPSLLDLREKFAIEFGWLLALDSNKTITVNGTKITTPCHEIIKENINIGQNHFSVSVIRWIDRPSSEISYIYLLNSDGHIVHKQLSTLNNKKSFFTSIFISSAWADAFQPKENLFFPDAHSSDSPEWKSLIQKLNEITQTIYENFLRQQVEVVVENYFKDGLFPTYSELSVDEGVWRLKNARALVRNIYMADPSIFNAASKKQRKIIIRLLDRLAVSNENESLLDILNSVLELDAKALSTLSDLLRQTTLDNIITTIEVLFRRQAVANKIKTLMNEHYKEVKETPDLQKIIENNTWIFGCSYETLGAEEDSFTKIARDLRNNIKTINNLSKDDIEGDDIAGAKRQTDLFLARRFPTIGPNGQQIYRCIVIEIKRPSISLNVKHLRQLDDYADIIKRHPEFSSDKLHFELILVGRKISSSDTEINSRLNGQLSKGELGLVSEDNKMKRYVLNWYTLLDSFELSNNFMLEKLKLKRSLYETETRQELVAELQQPQ